MSNTSILSEHIAGLKYGQLPEKTIWKAKRLILHVLAAALASADTPQACAATCIAAKKECAGKAVVWGSKGLLASAEDAAFSNATMADILDWEDCSWTGHPSAGVVPVALALGQALCKSGKEIIEAIVAGYDAYQRIAMSVQPAPEEWGLPGHAWGLTCWQVFAGAAAAAKLYDFDAKDIATCMGVTTHFTSIPGAVREESDIYHYAHGICARNGIAAAEIVSAGVDPIQRCFDGPNSLGRQLHETVEEEWYTKQLGEWYAIDDTLFKHWPANMWIQSPLDALEAMVKEHPFGADDVEKVEVSPDIRLYAKELSEPKTMMKAEFSLAYCFLAYLKNHKPSADWYSDANLTNEDVDLFEKKVHFLAPKKNPLEQFMVFWTGDFPDTTVRITLKDGKVLEKTWCYPKGHPRNAFSWEEEVQHFRSAVQCLEEEQCEKIVQMVKNLEELDDITPLCMLLMREKADE